MRGVFSQRGFWKLAFCVLCDEGEAYICMNTHVTHPAEYSERKTSLKKRKCEKSSSSVVTKNRPTCRYARYDIGMGVFSNFVGVVKINAYFG